MNALLMWLYVVMESLVLAWAPALVLAVVFLAIGLVFGWGWKALWLLPLGPVLALMILAGWGLSLPYVPEAAAGKTIRIAHANTLLYFNKPAGPKVAFAANSGADVVSLLEVNDTLHTALNEVSGTYPHQAHSGGRLPMMLLAKYPITKAQGWGPRMVLYHIAKPNQAFYVLQVHPQSPFSSVALASRTEQLQKLANILPSLPQPLVVLGDMNTTPWDAGLKPLHAALKQAGGWRANLPTFPTLVPMTPIDAVFYSQPFSEARLQHVKVKGSDHLGIVVDLVDPRQK